MFSTGKTINANGATLFVAEAGNPAGHPIVLLHGGLGTRNDFLPLAENLAADYRLIAIDSRGHGSSTLGNGLLTYEHLAHDIELIMEICHLEHPFIIGHSDGGITAIRIAAAKRRTLAGIVLMMTHEDPPSRDLLDGIFAKLTPAIWRAKFPDEVALYEQLNPVPDFDRLCKTVLEMWRDTGDGNYPGALVEQIDCPALILGGEADHLVPTEVTIKLAHRIPGARLGILPFGNHIVFKTNPERVAPYITEFIKTTLRT